MCATSHGAFTRTKHIAVYPADACSCLCGCQSRVARTASIDVLIRQSIMSFQTKINRSANAPKSAPSEIEQTIAQALIDLEQNVPELKSELRQLQISSAKEVDGKGGKKAVVIFVPVPQVKAFHTVQQR
jgi:hypothetical protein